jgi:hypothetical protein
MIQGAAISKHLLFFLVLGSAGCSLASPRNPSFPLERAAAQSALLAMESAPRELERPVVVLGGYFDPGLGALWVAREFRRLTGDCRIIPVSFTFDLGFDRCRERVIEKVDRIFPSADPVWTAEVDVIGVSMGGLVARHAAAPPANPAAGARRLRICRLFTISSPHRGARMASIPCFLPMHRDMRPGSEFLARLESAEQPRDYEIHAYVRLGDRIVGPEHAAPSGEALRWVSNPPFAPAHIGAVIDSRILADIARRLRGEEPYAREPRAPLP